jgi:hypothetical protein
MHNAKFVRLGQQEIKLDRTSDFEVTTELKFMLGWPSPHQTFVSAFKRGDILDLLIF